MKFSFKIIKIQKMEFKQNNVKYFWLRLVETQKQQNNNYTDIN